MIRILKVFALVVGVVFGFEFGVFAEQCNYFTPDILKFCKDPFTLCSGASDEQECDSADNPAMIYPGCVYTGNEFDHCDSSSTPTECNRTIDCIWSDVAQLCSEGEPNAVPTYTANYYSDPECVPPGGS